MESWEFLVSRQYIVDGACFKIEPMGNGVVMRVRSLAKETLPPGADTFEGELRFVFPGDEWGPFARYVHEHSADHRVE